MKAQRISIFRYLRLAMSADEIRPAVLVHFDRVNDVARSGLAERLYK